MLEFDNFDLLVGMVILIILLAILWRRKRNLSYLLFFSIFWVYLLAVVSVVVFPFPLPDVNTVNRGTFMPSVNLIPFYFGSCSRMPNLCVRSIVENILLTVPFGFGINFIAHPRRKDFLLLALAVGLGFEFTQLAISLAVKTSFRAVDINDVIFNATGVLLGYGLFRIFAWLYLKMAKRFRIRHWGLLVYILDIANQAQNPQITDAFEIPR